VADGLRGILTGAREHGRYLLIAAKVVGGVTGRRCPVRGVSADERVPMQASFGSPVSPAAREGPRKDRPDLRQRPIACSFCALNGAGAQDRTADLLITNQLLYP
jgi:hypothetical protein